jgi:hypothetical protein
MFGLHAGDLMTNTVLLIVITLYIAGGGMSVSLIEWVVVGWLC